MKTSTKPFKSREVHGILLLDKPTGLSSNRVLGQVKRLYQVQKAGHTGSLDPLASGMLPICLGKATKACSSLLEVDKHYQVRAKLGQRTNTSDADGEIISERKVPKFTSDTLETLLSRYRGSIKQIPSMYSALKFQGRPLYQLARQGITIERPSRLIHIYALTLVDMTVNEIELTVHCSKGTYIRTLIDDLGEDLGCGAHVIALRRTQVGHYLTQKMINMPTLRTTFSQGGLEALDAFLLPTETPPTQHA